MHCASPAFVFHSVIRAMGANYGEGGRVAGGDEGWICGR